MNDPAEQLRFRRQLTATFGVVPVAWSADGRTVHLTAPVESGLTVGSFGVVGDTDVRLAIQIRHAEMTERDGPTLDVSTLLDAGSGTVTSATARPMMRFITATGIVLGALVDGTLSPTDHTQPFPEDLVRAATHDEIAAIAASLTGGRPTIAIGAVRGEPDVPAAVVATGFSRHTFMCGQSGSGKTYTTGGLFERLLADTTLRILVLDPNSDHVHLGALRDPTDNSAEAERFRAAASEVRVARARGMGGDHTLCADFSDLTLEAQALLLRLHPIDDGEEFARLRHLTEQFNGHYSIDDVLAQAKSSGDPLAERLARRIVNLGIHEWDLWRRGDEISLADQGIRHERCVVLDLGSLSRPDERTSVALAVLGLQWRLRARREPVLIAIDEAHNVLPAATHDPLLAATADLGVLIAGEGRKFGLHLFVATQRPSKVHPNVVSQCDNLILMRMNGVNDVHDLAALFSHVPPDMLHESLTFGLGQALLAGPISPVPVFVQVGRRLSPEGGGDVPTTWAAR